MSELRIDLKMGDCLDVMKSIPDKSIDMILCDLPYGTTGIEWDKPIPFAPMWFEYERIIKENAAIVLFSAQPFTTDLISSNRKLFRYEIIWKKTTSAGFMNANRAPLRIHENILVFYKKLPTYHPIMSKVERTDLGRVKHREENRSKQYPNVKPASWTEKGMRFPTDVVEFSNWNGALFGKINNATKHPTQKPVDLCEYLISTYTNPHDVVLDNCMGSGTTGVACSNLQRSFIGIEMKPEYFAFAEMRIKNATMQSKFPGFQMPENPNSQLTDAEKTDIAND